MTWPLSAHERADELVVFVSRLHYVCIQDGKQMRPLPPLARQVTGHVLVSLRASAGQRELLGTALNWPLSPFFSPQIPTKPTLVPSKAANGLLGLRLSEFHKVGSKDFSPLQPRILEGNTDEHWKSLR